MSGAAVQVQSPFAQIPEALLYDGSLPADAVRVYGVLHRYGTQPGNCYPSHATIAGHIGKSERSIPGWIKALEEAGWVARVPRWRKGGEVSTAPPDDEEGWEPTSNGYYLYAIQRAGERGDPAGERGPLPAGERTPSPLESAPKESHVNESHLERENEAAAPDGALVSTDGFDEFWDNYPRRNGRRVGRAPTERIWRRLKPEQRADALVCLVNYAAACNNGQTYAKDPHRWLRPDVWPEWREAPEPTRPTISKSTTSLAEWANARTDDNPERKAIG